MTDPFQPQKKKPLEVATSQRTSATQLRPTPRGDGRPLDADLVSLQEVLAEKENEIQREINMKIAQHQKWNEGYIDFTRAPLTPPLEDSLCSSFRTAMTEYLPTPPASVSSEQSGDAVGDVSSPSRNLNDSVTVRYVSPSYGGPSRIQPSFRRRVGRGGRMMIDRRGMNLQSKEGIDPKVVDRFKYDRDDDDDEEMSNYPIDPFEISSMRYRAAIVGSSQTHPQAQSVRRAQIETSATTSQGPLAAARSSSLPKIPSSE